MSILISVGSSKIGGAQLAEEGEFYFKVEMKRKKVLKIFAYDS